MTGESGEPHPLIPSGMCVCVGCTEWSWTWRESRDVSSDGGERTGPLHGQTPHSTPTSHFTLCPPLSLFTAHHSSPDHHLPSTSSRLLPLSLRWSPPPLYDVTLVLSSSGAHTSRRASLSLLLCPPASSHFSVRWCRVLVGFLVHEMLCWSMDVPSARGDGMS